MLAKLRVGDFAGWEGAEPVRLAPLTLFVGPNGAGKSTLIRAVCDKAAKRRRSLSPYRLRRGDRELEEILGRWLAAMGVVDDFTVTENPPNPDPLAAPGGLPIPGAWSLAVRPRGGDTFVPVIRAGGGAGHALLVLVRAFSRTTTAPVHLDHPEGNLQPCAQSGLADAMLAAVRVKRHGTQLLVETHSEYLIRRLQRRIAEGQVAKDRVAAYLVNARDGKREIQELIIDEQGGITNWPHDLFGPPDRPWP